MDAHLSAAHDRRARLPVAAWLRLARVYGSTLRGLGALLRPHGLSVAEFDVLAQLGPRAGITQQQLAARLLVSQPNVSYHVRRLSDAGMIERRRDGRHKRLSLTPAGQELHDRLVPSVEAWHARQFAALPGDDLAHLTRILRRLERASAAPGGDTTSEPGGEP